MSNLRSDCRDLVAHLPIGDPIRSHMERLADQLDHVEELWHAAERLAKPKPSFAPVYAAAIYPELAAIAREHGYALSVHGSLQRDFDVVAIPWAELVSDPQVVVDDITSRFAVRVIGEQPGIKNHGRIAYTISIGHGQCSIDLSFMPKEEQ